MLLLADDVERSARRGRIDVRPFSSVDDVGNPSQRREIACTAPEIPGYVASFASTARKVWSLAGSFFAAARIANHVFARA